MSIAELPSNRAPRDTNISSIGADFERTPPQDLIAEQSVLGGMLLSKDAIADVIEIIRDRDFYRPAHELIYDAIIDLYGRGEPVDAVTVSSELTKRGVIARAGGALIFTLLSLQFQRLLTLVTTPRLFANMQSCAAWLKLEQRLFNSVTPQKVKSMTWWIKHRLRSMQ